MISKELGYLQSRCTGAYADKRLNSFPRAIQYVSPQGRRMGPQTSKALKIGGKILGGWTNGRARSRAVQGWVREEVALFRLGVRGNIPL
jgi:hypothetical protein